MNLPASAHAAAWWGWVRRSVRHLFRGLPGDRWVYAPHVSALSPVVVGGCGRSGTTLLSVMLDGHRNLCCGAESRLLCSLGLNPRRLAALYHLPAGRVREMVRASPSKAQFVERFAAACCAAAGKSRWAEKSPGNVKALPWVFEHFPAARFVHVIRDGRDVACSLRTHPKYKLKRDGRRVETGIRRPIRWCARRWVQYVRAGLNWRHDPRYTEVRYADLVLRTETTLRRLAEFLGEPWDPAMLDFYQRQCATADPRRAVQNPGVDQPLYTAAIGRWRHDLSPSELREFYDVAGPLMDELGYGRE